MALPRVWFHLRKLNYEWTEYPYVYKLNPPSTKNIYLISRARNTNLWTSAPRRLAPSGKLLLPMKRASRPARRSEKWGPSHRESLPSRLKFVSFLCMVPNKFCEKDRIVAAHAVLCIKYLCSRIKCTINNEEKNESRPAIVQSKSSCAGSL